MCDFKCVYTSLIEVMISSNNEGVCIRDMNDLTLQIIFEAWLTSINVDFKLSIAWNDFRHASCQRFYLHYWVEETGSPGIICIIRHQVLRYPPEHVTSSLWKHLLAIAHIAIWIQLIESTIYELSQSTFDETALAILMTKGSWWMTIVRSQLKLLMDI